MPEDPLWQEIAVHCRSEYTYAQEPRTVVWPGGSRTTVTAITKAWASPDGKYFHVDTTKGPLELRYLEGSGTWQGRKFSLRQAHREP